ncbi:MAG: hypothetical protein ACHWZW_01890 [Spirulina sp.]
MLSDYAPGPMFLALRYGYPRPASGSVVSIQPEMRYGELVRNYPPKLKAS